MNSTVLHLSFAKWRTKAFRQRKRAAKAEEIGYLRDLNCRILLSVLEIKQRQITFQGFQALKNQDYRQEERVKTFSECRKLLLKAKS